MTFHRPATITFATESRTSPVAPHYIHSRHWGNDEQPENPATTSVLPRGGMTTGPGMTLVWQDGHIARDGRGNPIDEANGTFVEDVVIAAIGRLEFYQATAFPCEENTAALEHLNAALDIMIKRRDRRTEQGTIGTDAEQE